MTEHEIIAEQHERWEYHYLIDSDSPEAAAQDVLQSGRVVERTFKDLLEFEVRSVDVHVRQQIPLDEARSLMQEQVNTERRESIDALQRADLCQRILEAPHLVTDENLKRIAEWADTIEPERRRLGIATLVEIERSRRRANLDAAGGT